jgi:hypothetical protein
MDDKSHIKPWRRTVTVVLFLLMFLLLIVIVLWQLGVFNTPAKWSDRPQSWSKIKPQIAKTGLNPDGEFTAVFTNGARSEVTLDPSSIKILQPYPFENKSCDTIIGFNTTKVLPGEDVQLTAAGCGARERGTTYSIWITFSYSESDRGITTTHSEGGTIRGPVE